jgi:protein tyrosine phosphatase (PTP) superfamily phosphohydrolase (DUF442 family)
MPMPDARRRVFCAWLAGAWLAPTASRAQPAGLQAPNVVVISPWLTTSGQPSVQALAGLGAAGYQGVIYLAPPTVPGAVPDEAEILGRQGIRFTNVPIAFGHPTEGDYDAFAAAMAQLQGRKVLVHCEVNMRGSSMAFLHRVLAGGESPDAAYPSLSQVWTPNGTWKAFIVAMLKKHGIAFEPY